MSSQPVPVNGQRPTDGQPEGEAKLEPPDAARRDGKGKGGRRRPRREVVRRIDTWSVLKVSVVFYVALYSVFLIAGVLLWTAATSTGLRHNVERFIADLIASGKFHFVGSELFRGAVIGGGALVILGTAANVLLSVLYNLISEVIGGLSIVVEERPLRRAAPEPVYSEVPAPVAAGAAVGVPEVELKRPRRSPKRAPTAVRP